MMREISDTEKRLIEELTAGSERAFEELYRCYAGKLFGFAMRFTQQDRYASEEVVQHVFIKVWELRAKISSHHSFFSFLCSITKNHLLNQHEHRMVEFVYKNYVLHSSSETDDSTEEQLDCSFLDEFIQHHVEQLPPVRQQIFRMSRYEHLNNRDIARRLGLSESTVENQITAALKYLKKHITAYVDYIVTWLLFIVN